MDQRRERLAQRLLALTPGVPATEAEQRFGAAATSLALEDMVGHIARAVIARGPGLPFVHPDGELSWEDPTSMADQLRIAEAAGETLMIDVFRDILALLDKLDPENHVLLAMTSARTLRVFRLPVDDPGAGVRRLLNEWGR